MNELALEVKPCICCQAQENMSQMRSAQKHAIKTKHGKTATDVMYRQTKAAIDFGFAPDWFPEFIFASTLCVFCKTNHRVQQLQTNQQTIPLTYFQNPSFHDLFCFLVIPPLIFARSRLSLGSAGFGKIRKAP